MEDQETTDLTELQDAVIAEKLSMYYYMDKASGWDEAMLHAAGQKTVEGAIVSRFKSAQKKITELHKAYTKKYPD